MRRAPLLVVVTAVVVLAGCVEPTEIPPGAPPGVTPSPDGTGGGGGTVPEVRVNGSRAWDLAYEQVHAPDGSVRYRVPGTAGNAEAAALIEGHLADLGFETAYDHFNATYGCEEVAMHNVIGVREGTDPSRVIYLGAHYDTRPIADKDPDAEARDEPIHGANDGASGVGVLLALAEALDGRHVTPTLKFVFFDGEDGGGYKGYGCTDWILGSTHYAEALTADEVARSEAMVLVDLVGAPDLRIPREQSSTDRLQDELYAIAGSLGYDQFVNETGIPVVDDHKPFLDRGIPAVDLIHLRETNATQRDPFPAVHHRHSDTMENVSAASLEAVGRVVERWILER